MDIKLEKKKGIQKKHIPYIIGGAALVVILGSIIFGNHASTLKVDARGLNIGEVKEEQFNDFVREKVVEEGAQVKKGDVIIRLSNSNLDLQILNAEAELAEKQNFLRNTQVTMEQDKLANETERAQYTMEVRRAQRAFNQQEQLYKEDLIAKEDYLKAKEDYELAAKKYELVVKKLSQDSISRRIQMEELEMSLSNMRRNIQLIHERKENLNVRSQINGELGLLDVVLGQNISPGQKVGQVNDLSDYKIEAMIDEHYIDRVKQGLSATFDRQNSKFDLSVRKVFPEVRDGKFRTEFIFTGERPKNIRTGQTYYINLELGQPTESLIIPKGTFFQNTGGNWIFVLDQDGKKAYRRQIKIGRQNPQYYEVLEGLEPGEKVIVSSYEAYKKNEILILQ